MFHVSRQSWSQWRETTGRSRLFRLSSPRLVTIDTMASRKRKSKSSDDDHHSKRRQESSSSWPPTSFLECSHCWDDDNNDTASSSVAINNAAATYGTCDNVSTRYQKICLKMFQISRNSLCQYIYAYINI